MNSQDQGFYNSLISKLSIDKKALEKAMRVAKKEDRSLIHVIIQMELANSEKVIEVYSKCYGVKYADLDSMDIPQNIIQLIPSELAKKFQLVPIDRVGQNIIVATTNPLDLKLIDIIRFKTGYTPKTVFAKESAITNSLGRYYHLKGIEIGKDSKDDFSKSVSKKASTSRAVIGEPKSKDEQKAMGPIIKFVDQILVQCLSQGASDIHIEPYENFVRVRLRIDGVLHEIARPSVEYSNPLISRIKIMANLDIAERRLPQDGSIRVTINQKPIDFRVNTLPTLYGEKVVLRVLDKSNLQVDMTKLGFEKVDFDRFNEAIKKPFGMVLVTGPTGSGKTTTLYSALSELNKTKFNLVTAEDPVEFNLEGINQVQINSQINFEFSTALKAFLRQDPDIIMVGEIRDRETGEIALKAALTGHLVLSTLHTNSAADTIVRLQNLGLESFNLTSALNAVVAQRLVKKICDKCKAKDTSTTPEALIKLGVHPQYASKIQPMKGMGCPRCNQTGYSGRIAIFEVMTVNDAIKEAILKDKSAFELKRIGIKTGMRTLRQNALNKLAIGQTDAIEVASVTAPDTDDSETNGGT